MLPVVIPIFPLPNVVLFPTVFLPLHIFEPRYREMVADALRGDRLIGMVLLKPGWERDYEGRPPVYSVGCAGLVTYAEPLSDGRYNIILRGLQKFRVIDEDARRLYRLATIEAIAEPSHHAEAETLRIERRRLEGLIGSRIERLSAPASMPDEDLVNALAQHLEFEPLEKQALLECDGLLARCQSLVDLLEMRVLATRQSWGQNGQH